MKKVYCIIPLLLGLAAGVANAQNTTVSGTVTDSDGFNWIGATINFSLPPGNYKCNNVPMTPSQRIVSATLNSSGTFSTTVCSSGNIAPLGTLWNINICTPTNVPCANLSSMAINGSSIDLSSTINQQIRPLRFPAIEGARGYGDVEVTPIPIAGATYWNITLVQTRVWTGSGWTSQGGGGGGGVPSPPPYSVQFANSSNSAFSGNANLIFDPTVNRLYDKANLQLNALESLPRATYDPMDTRYNGGLAAAIAGTSGFTPTQVIQAAIDYGQCQIQTGATQFQGENIVLPSNITINIAGLKLWSNTSFGGDNSTNNPIVQHVDASQVMISAHGNSDVLTCGSNTYTPASSGVGAVLIHDISIAGMFAPATHTDIGIELNMFGSIAKNIRGANQAFGGPAVISNGTSTFLIGMGTQGAQLQGCHTYNSGILPVSAFALGGGRCASVIDGALDGGASDSYVSDGQAFSSGHAAGPCYPNCAAYLAGGSGTFDDQIFAQVSGVGVIVSGTARLHGIRVDDTSREAIQFSGAFGGSTVEQVGIDSACVDTALQANYAAGTATGCHAITVTSGGGYHVSEVTLGNSAGIFSPAYVQCWFQDGNANFSGASSFVDDLYYQGNPNNTSANDWAVCGSNAQTGPRYYLPAMPGMALTASTTILNASGLSNAILNGQTVNSITGGNTGQHLSIIGNGTVQQTSGIFNLNGQDNTISCGSPDVRTCQQVLEYVNTGPPTTWIQIVGNPNQTPTHINWAGNPAVTAPSLLDIYGNQTFRQMPAFSIAGAVQLFGPTVGAGQYCFEQEQVWPDGTHVVSSQTCTTVDITSGSSSGEIFKFGAPQTVDSYLWLVSNTTGSGVTIGKYPSHAFWVPSVLAVGGDGTTAPTASDNTTGYPFLPFGALLNTYSNTQPACTAVIRGRLWLVSGGGTGPDNYQICVETTGATYTWTNIGTSSGGVVNTFNGRSGIVSPASADYTAAQVTNAAATNAANIFTGINTFNNDVKINSSNALWAAVVRDTAGASVITTATGRATFPNLAIFTGGLTNNASNSLSGSSEAFNGAPVTGGTTTTTTPLFLMQPNGTTAASNWSTNGTFFGINANSGWNGQFFNVLNNNQEEFQVTAFGSVNGVHFGTFSGCASSASPAVCGAQTMGAVAVPAGTNPTLQVNSTAVTANSQIMLTEDQSLNARLSVTCQTAALPTSVVITSRTAGASFTFQVNGTFTTNPVCYNFSIFN